MSPSLQYLQRCSTETGYGVGPLEQVVRLGELAADISRHPFLGKVLALKGGSALNLCFGPPMRLSVDLDFNYIGQSEREKMLEDRPRVEAAVTDLGRRKGYQIQQSADAFAGRKIYLLYRSVLGQAERIEVDLNFLFRVPLSGTETREMWQPGELDIPKVRVVSLEEILIGKLLALFSRGAARDVWDMSHLPTQAEDVLRSSRFRARFIALSAILDHPLTTYTRARIESLVTERTVREQLAPLLAVDVAPRLSDLVDKAWGVIGNFLELKDNEREYLAALQRGESPTDLLFSNDLQEAVRIAAHPAILWKLENVRSYLARKGKEIERT